MKDRVDAILKRPQAEYLESILPQRDALLARMEAFAAEHNHPIADAEVAQLVRVLLRARKPARVRADAMGVPSLDNEVGVEGVTLFRSHLGSPHPRYEAIARLGLQGGSVAG